MIRSIVIELPDIHGGEDFCVAMKIGDAKSLYQELHELFGSRGNTYWNTWGIPWGGAYPYEYKCCSDAPLEPSSVKVVTTPGLDSKKE